MRKEEAMERWAWLCKVFGHGKHLVEVAPFRKLCMRCDTTVFTGPVKVQGERYMQTLNRMDYRKGMKARHGGHGPLVS